MRHTLHIGDNLTVLPTLPDNSVDAIVTDPPYGLSFMGKRWDYDVPGVKVWAECLRVLKPGGHLLAFSGSRTYHRMTCAIEDAGFAVRDQIMWVYGSGFPKSHNISKALDKSEGNWRGRAGKVISGNGAMSGGNYERTPIGSAITEAAKQWDGWGTALKPAHEPIVLARKPLDGTVVDNIRKWGVGGLNIDGCRVAMASEADAAEHRYNCEGGYKRQKDWHLNDMSKGTLAGGWKQPTGEPPQVQGRWPANLMHDGSQEVLDLFPDVKTQRCEKPSNCNTSGETNFDFMRGNRPARGYDDDGSAARFFYCPKASKRDRDEGCEGINPVRESDREKNDGVGGDNPRNRSNNARCNHHPTVKPTDLMRYLCRLITPPGGTVLDPFMGSGSTGKAAILEGFNFIGIELSPDYAAIAEARINAAYKEPD